MPGGATLMLMKIRALLVIVILFWAFPLLATPKFWNPQGTPTLTPLPVPNVEAAEEPQDFLTMTPTPVIAPAVELPTPTPTPQPGLQPINPTQAALFSVVIPGSGQVYAGDPLKGLALAALFGAGLWQTLDNLQLVPSSSGLVAKKETAGSLFGLATLAVYGFGIQDAYNTAENYNRDNHLALRFNTSPCPNIRLAYLF
jgi:hypothetical protein